MNDTTLIFLSSNRKGDKLYEELAKHFAAARYIPAGYQSLPLLMRLVPRFLDKIGQSVKNQPAIDWQLRRAISRRAYAQARRIASAAEGPVEQVHWHNLFPLTQEWRLLGRASLMTDVAMNEEYFEFFGIRAEKAKAARRELWATSIRHCDHVFTHSHWAATANHVLYPDHAAKIRRVGWGSDMPALPRKDALKSRTRPQIISIGHDYYRKGMDRYDEVAGQLKQLIPGLECVVVGKPGNGLPATQLRHLTVLGPLGRAPLADALTKSSLFMLFSRLEPAGHVTIEAMSYGLPVVCSGGGGLAEPVIDNVTGFVCSPWSAEVVVERARCLLTQPYRLAEFRQNAYDHVMRNWQWSQVAERIVAVLGESEPVAPAATAPQSQG